MHRPRAVNRAGPWELSLGRPEAPDHDAGAQANMGSGRHLAPPVCRGPGYWLPEPCFPWNSPAAGYQTCGKLVISVVFQSVKSLSFLQDPRLIA